MAATTKRKHEKIRENKVATPIDMLCCGVLLEFTTYFQYCRSLEFDDEPDYSRLHKLFRDLFTRHGAFETPCATVPFQAARPADCVICGAGRANPRARNSLALQQRSAWAGSHYRRLFKPVWFPFLKLVDALLDPASTLIRTPTCALLPRPVVAGFQWDCVFDW